MTLWHAAFLFIAASVGGAINSVAGGGTLITFPALVWIGIDPIIANATNTVSLWPGSLAALLGLQSELGVMRRWMIRLGVPSVVGAAIGAVLLMRTPSPLFAAIVPYLILFATVLFALQGPATRGLRRFLRPPSRSRGLAHPADPHSAPGHPTRQADREAGHLWWPLVAVFQLGVAVYGGYFGAGIGIMMLAALGLLGFTDIHQMIGLRNFCAVLINAVAALYFAARGAVYWPEALVMTAGQIAGGYGGARLVRRLGSAVVRRIVVVIGVGMAISLLLRS